MNLIFKWAAIALLFFSGISLQAQHIIKGKIVDDEGGVLPAATVMLLAEKDSMLQSFALSGADGSFLMKSVPKGVFILKATFGQLEPLAQKVEVSGEQKEIDLGDLILVQKSSQLGSVEITDELIPVRIKGDTIEYAAGAFKVQPNAAVEDLLKRLPGVEVDAEGNVKAQGENVQRILVDGKEFFGNDPKVASKNLPADAVDKVQVFEKLSDMADFTGVDDGDRSRTINLTLKENRKNGVFGDIGAGYGYGDDHRFRAKSNINRFTEKAQLSFLGMGNNINEQAFSMTDYVNFMGGGSSMMSGGGGMGGGGGGEGGGGSLTPGDLGISWRGGGTQSTGISTSAAGGINYNVDLSPKTKIQSSYFYNFLRLDLNEQKYRENILQERSFITEDTTDKLDKNHNNRINMRITHQIDSSSKLIFTGSGKLNLTNSLNQSSTRSLAGNSLRNLNLRDENTLGGNYNVASTLLYMKKFGNRGRSFTLQGALGGLQNQNKETDILSLNGFNLDTLGFVQDTLNQNQQEVQNRLTYSGKATYTEPIGKRKFLEFLYTHEENMLKLDKQFFDVLSPTERTLNPLLSNRYDGVYRFDQPAVNFRILTKKSNFTAGIGGQRSELDGTFGLQDSIIHKTFYNLLPSARWNYTIKKGSRIRLNYSTRVNAPSIDQLSPVVNNTNPLYISRGNPDLEAEYAHSFRANYMLFDEFSFTTLFTNLTATYTRNKISQATSVDSLFRQVSTFANVDRDLNLNWFGHFSTPVRALKIKVNASPSVAFGNSISLINGIENPTNRLTSSLDLSVENRKKEHYDLRAGARLTHNVTRYAIDAGQNQEYLNSKFYSELNVYLPKGFTLNTAFDYFLYTGGGFDTNQSVPLLKAYVGKTFLKNNRGELRLSAFDLLNQNTGIDRTTAINYLEESRFNTLKRYYMLSFTYKIMSVGKGKKKSKENDSEK